MITTIKEGVDLHLGDSVKLIKQLESGSVDLTITSPPYDNLRHYNGSGDVWGEHVWKELISELYRVTAPGGVAVWLCGLWVTRLSTVVKRVHLSVKPCTRSNKVFGCMIR